MSPDLIVLADTVHTLDSGGGAGEGRTVQAVAIRDGVIVAVGDRLTARRWRGRGTQVIDLGAATLTPGLVDSHTHPVSGLDLARGVDLSAATSLPAVRALLAAEAERRAADEWVLGWGLDPNVFGDGPIGAAAVEASLGGRPAFLRLYDVHSAIASTRALALAGVDGPRRFADRSQIVCDDTGRPTGLLLEFAAMQTVQQVVPHQPVERRREALVGLLTEMARTGLTGGHVMDLDGDGLAVVRAVEEAGDLPIRLRLAPIYHPGSGDDGVDELVALHGTGGRRWLVGGVKLFMDGTIDNGTAWLEEPDVHGQSAGPSWLDPAEYTRIVKVFAEQGVPTATHAIGDAAVRHVVDSLGGLPAPPSGPHRVEHLETLPAELVRAFAAGGLVASMQPTHCTHFVRPDGTDNWSVRLGPGRAARGWPLRELRDLGVPLALGSDWPVAPFDARAILADAQLRRRAGHPDEPPLQASQALTARMALEGMTTQAALAAGEHGVAGRIAPGMRADLTAFAVDPLRSAPDELVDAPILLTAVDGRIIHRAPSV